MLLAMDGGILEVAFPLALQWLGRPHVAVQLLEMRSAACTKACNRTPKGFEQEDTQNLSEAKRSNRSAEFYFVLTQRQCADQEGKQSQDQRSNHTTQWAFKGKRPPVQ